jgi:uncharacterized protein
MIEMTYIYPESVPLEQAEQDAMAQFTAANNIPEDHEIRFTLLEGEEKSYAIQLQADTQERFESQAQAFKEMEESLASMRAAHEQGSHTA